MGSSTNSTCSVCSHPDPGSHHRENALAASMSDEAGVDEPPAVRWAAAGRALCVCLCVCVSAGGHLVRRVLVARGRCLVSSACAAVRVRLCHSASASVSAACPCVCVCGEERVRCGVRCGGYRVRACHGAPPVCSPRDKKRSKRSSLAELPVAKVCAGRWRGKRVVCRARDARVTFSLSLSL